MRVVEQSAAYLLKGTARLWCEREASDMKRHLRIALVALAVAGAVLFLAGCPAPNQGSFDLVGTWTWNRTSNSITLSSDGTFTSQYPVAGAGTYIFTASKIHEVIGQYGTLTLSYGAGGTYAYNYGFQSADWLTLAFPAAGATTETDLLDRR